MYDEINTVQQVNTMTLSKSKPVDRTLPVWLDALVGPLYLDFVAPMPLEEALQRLKAEEVSGFFRRIRIQVSLIQCDADTFNFHVQRRTGNLHRTHGRGILKRLHNGTTVVMGQVNVGIDDYLIFPIMLGLAAVYVFICLQSWFGFLYLGMLLLYWYSMRRSLYEVVRLIETALEAEIGNL
jgi:hypothetical protein